jgi:hypothetical protein
VLLAWVCALVGLTSTQKEQALDDPADLIELLLIGVLLGDELTESANVCGYLLAVMPNQTIAFFACHVVNPSSFGVSLACLSHAGIDDVMNDVHRYVQRVRDQNGMLDRLPKSPHLSAGALRSGG